MSDLILPHNWINVVKQKTQISRDKQQARSKRLYMKFIKDIENGLAMSDSTLRRKIRKAAKRGEDYIVIRHPLIFGYHEFLEARKERELVCDILKEKYNSLNFSFRNLYNIGWVFTITW